MSEDFYGLLPIKPGTFLDCTDGNVANLVMIKISDRLVGFFKIARSREEASNYPTQSVKIGTHSVHVGSHQKRSAN